MARGGNVIRGGRPRPLSNLQIRREAFDKLREKDGRTRPGSTNAHKQA